MNDASAAIRVAALCGNNDHRASFARVMPSAVIRSFKYDAARRELDIVFPSGRRYIYRDVPEETFQAMKASFSKGELFNAHIRDRFRFVRSPAS